MEYNGTHGGNEDIPHRKWNGTCAQKNRPPIRESSRPNDLRISIKSAKALSLALLTIIALFPPHADSQSRRQNSLDELEWEDSEEDQQCEMVVKCKPSKTASSSSSSPSNAPETSTYRVPLKPYGAPFNPMAEGGSLNWQKMGTTPKSGKKSKVSSTTIATNYAEKSDDDKDEKASGIFFFSSVLYLVMVLFFSSPPYTPCKPIFC